MNDQFPPTPWSLIAQLREGTAEKQTVMKQMLERYWHPVAQALDWLLKNEPQAISQAYADLDFETLVQHFFCWVLKPEKLAELNPEQLQFRSYLKEQLREFVALSRLETSLGEDLFVLPQPQVIEASLTSTAMHDSFDTAWVVLLFSRSLEKLKQHSLERNNPLYIVFCTHDAPALSLDETQLSQISSLSEEALEEAVWTARRLFRGFLLADLTEYCPDQRSVQMELQWLLSS